jgi:hypothetical protein
MERKENQEFGTGYFTHMIIMSAVTRAEFVSDWKFCIILRDRWYDKELNIKYFKLCMEHYERDRS